MLRMATPHPYVQVDVFGSGPCTGNPLGVVVDAAGLDSATMAAFSRWTNLSEVTFLAPPTQPGADYAVRIFAGTRELPFAGHPTLGSAHAWLSAGGTPRASGVVVQECGAGLVRVRLDADGYSLAAPPRTRTGPLSQDDLARAAAFLGLSPGDVIDHEWGVNGPLWAMLQLASDQAVRDVQPAGPTQLGFDVGVVGLAASGSPFAYEVRAFLPEPQVVEDPVTGSLNAAVAQWLRGKDAVPARYVAVQGSRLGASGEVRIEDDGTDIWVGGRATIVISGTAAV